MEMYEGIERAENLLIAARENEETSPAEAIHEAIEILKATLEPKTEIEARLGREVSKAEKDLIKLCEAFREYIASESNDEKFPEVNRTFEICWPEGVNEFYSEEVEEHFEILHSVYFHADRSPEQKLIAAGYYDESVCGLVELLEEQKAEKK